MTHRFYMVDVFAEHPYAGNQLAVFVGTDPLPGETMQQLAAEMNFSETTFVTSDPEIDGGYRVRIFTPAREIAFTGHPILGTAWVIRHYVESELSTQQVRLNLSVGQVPVTFETDADGREVAWFRAPPMSLEAKAPLEPVAAALGLSPQEIDTRAPIQVISAGTSAMIVPLSTLDALRRSRLNLEVFAPLLTQGYPPLVYLFCSQTLHSQNDLSARFYFEAHGVREDPATGNGAAFLGAYLLAHKLYPESALSLRIEQGHDVRRPSLIMLRARMLNGAPEVAVGGNVIPILRGELL
ncbi:MAG: PhzF family phenazine biosynthesis protein [Candidatus Thiodiazotropha sp. (ex Cardiolucina cf. quadrata)]|nr:PhzF family phenazine biosynthesis protein [Candidatus Thiodiazotropha sp. (ex Cardiolucina cf. quadrata)]